ncbi:MAG TPA: PAS domain S-box protein, partial [Candidatus Bathyarchaeia archaeon]
FKIISAATRKIVDDPVAKVLKKGQIVGLANHTTLIRQNGTEVPIDDSGAPIKDKDGKTTGVVLIFRDITERRKAEEALNQSEAHLRAYVTSSTDAVYSMTPDWSEMRQLTGNNFISDTVKPDRLWMEKYIHPDDRQHVKAVINRAIRTKSVFELEHRVITVDDSLGWTFSRAIPLLDKDGRIIEWFGTAKDVTERKKAEEALSRINEELEERVQKRTQEVSSERQRLYNVLETLPAYVVLLDKDYRMPFANKVFRETFGESQGRRCHEYLFGRDSECENCETYKVLKTNKAQHWEWTGPNKHDYEIYDYPFIEADGSTLILEMGIDVTERKKAEKQIHDVSLYSRSLIEASLDPLVTINSQGKITDVNQATVLITGCSKAELIGSDFSDYFIEPEKAKMGYKRVFAEGVVKDYPLAIKHKNGRISEVLYNATVYRNNAGEIQGVFAAARDITEQKKAEAEAQEAAKKLKDAERLAAIGATAGMVGHDIRNPLQAITGDLFLAKSELSELPDNENKTNALESLDEIQNNVDYINKIVADLQDFARPLNPRAQETDVESVFNDVLGKNGIPENVKVSVDVEDRAKRIMADPDYLKRIAANLTLNAIQAMPNGGKLTIRACVDKATDDVLITVKDTGVGIPEDIKPKLFTPMMTTKSKGQGFGLAVVKRMTEGLGGTVTFESTEGKGTTFTVRLPPKK